MAGSLNSFVTEAKKLTDQEASKKIESSNATYDEAATQATEQAEKEITKTQNSYTEQFRKNELAQIINEEKTKKRMSDLGLTDSGLNRTQQTAIQLQRANVDYYTQQQRQSAVDSIRSSLAEFLAENAQKKAQAATDIQAEWDNQAYTMGTSAYNAQVEAENKARENRLNAENELLEIVYDGSVDASTKKAKIERFMQLYGENTSLDYNDLVYKAGLTVQQNAKTGEKYIALPLSYSLVKTKNTINGLWGVDYNDEITIVDNNTGKAVKTLRIDKIPGLNREQKMKLTNLATNNSLSLTDLGISSEFGINNFINTVLDNDSQGSVGQFVGPPAPSASGQATATWENVESGKTQLPKNTWWK